MGGCAGAGVGGAGGCAGGAGAAVSLAANVCERAPTMAPVYDSAPGLAAVAGPLVGVAADEDDARFSPTATVE